MVKFDDRAIANMDVVLEQVCRTLSPIGGDHESRKFIARKLMRAARNGETRLKGLEVIGRRALMQLRHRTLA